MTIKNIKIIGFIVVAAVLITAGALAMNAIGFLKVNPILGHDLDLNGLYYGQAANNTVHDITTQDI